VPTYQEAPNLRLLLPRIASTLTGGTATYEVLILDDRSDDETPEVVAAESTRMPVRLIIREGPRDLSLA
jgi:glycosyltransferase involved in cell wall biosynthesis